MSNQLSTSTNSPLVTAVITTYNRPQLVRRAIKSVLAQTYEPLEIIVVEDGSDSGVEAWLQDKGLHHIQYIRHKDSKGLATARNTGLRHAQGKYVAYLDDDDGWLPEKIALQVEVLESYPGQNRLVYCGTCGVSDGQIVSEYIPTARGPMANFVYKGYTLPQSCMVVSRDSLLSIGGHSEELVSCIDHDIWMKMARAGFYMDFVPKGLVYANQHGHSRMMKRLDERLQGIEQFFRKWKPVVAAECGMDSWRIIEGIYYLQTIHTIKRQYLDDVITKQVALDHLRKLISLQSQPFLWADYLAFRVGRLHYIPLGNNVVSIARRIATYPFRKFGRWVREHALSNPE